MGAYKFDPDEVVCNFNGVEVSDFRGFKPEGIGKETSFIKGVHGPTGHQHKYGEPKVTLKVGADSNILRTADETAYDLNESKATFSLIFQTPFKTYTCTDCVVSSIDDGEQKDETPEVTITILPLKITISVDNTSQVT